MNRMMEVSIGNPIKQMDKKMNYLRFMMKALQNYFSKVDFLKFSKEELGQIGFLNYKDEMMLIPAWAFPIVMDNHRGFNLRKVIVNNVNQINEDSVVEISNNLPPVFSHGFTPYGIPFHSLKL